MDQESLGKLENTQKVASRFTPWIIVLFLLLLLAGGVFYLYQSSGIKEYRSVLSALDTLSGDDKEREYTELFIDNPEQLNFHGGILAGAWRYGLWMWGWHGLTYYTIEGKNEMFTIATNCKDFNKTRFGLKDSETPEELELYLFLNGGVPKSEIPDIVEYPDLKEWKSRVRTGTYIQVQAALDDGTKLRSVTAYPEFRGTENWMFCYIYVPQE